MILSHGYHHHRVSVSAMQSVDRDECVTTIINMTSFPRGFPFFQFITQIRQQITILSEVMERSFKTQSRGNANHFNARKQESSQSIHSFAA